MENFSNKIENLEVAEEKLITEIRDKLSRLLYQEDRLEAKEYFASLNDEQKKNPEIRNLILNKFVDDTIGYRGSVGQGKYFADEFELSKYEKNQALSDALSSRKIGGLHLYTSSGLDRMKELQSVFDIPAESIREAFYVDMQKYPSLFKKEFTLGLMESFGLERDRFDKIFVDSVQQTHDKLDNPPLYDYFEEGHTGKMQDDLYHLRASIENFEIPKEIFEPALQSLIAKSLERQPDKRWIIKKILAMADLPKELLQDQNIAEKEYGRVMKNLEKWYGNDSYTSSPERIFDDLNEQYQCIPLADEYYYRPEMRKFIEKSINKLLSSNGYLLDTYGHDLIESPLPKEIIAKTLAKTMIQNKQKVGYMDKKVSAVLKKIPISQQLEKEAALEVILEASPSKAMDMFIYVRDYVLAVSDAELTVICKQLFFETSSFAFKKELNAFAGGKIDPMLTRAVEIFGDFANESNYNTIKSLHEGVLEENAKVFGITKTGSEGIAQMEHRMSALKTEILDDKFDPEILERSILARDFFKSYIRYDESAFGRSDDENFAQIIADYQKGIANGTRPQLNPGFEPSGEIIVESIDRDAQDSFKWGEHFSARYATLVEDLQKVIVLDREQFPITKMIDAMEEKRKKLLDELNRKLGEMQNEKGLDVLRERIEKLQSVELRSLRDFQENFLVISSFKEFHSELRQAMFLWSVAKNRPNLNERLGKIRSDNPTVDDVSDVIDFIDHITNQETMFQYFSDKIAKKSFEKLTSTIALQKELSRAQNQNTKGTKSLEFIPTKGILMEFSGHLADACWADQQNIAEEFPNFTSTVFVQNRGTKAERIAGASFLIEAKAKNGDDLLIIRGLNPLQNVINQLSVKDFYDKYIEYLRPIAEKNGRKLAIVIDGHCGGAATNRPTLYAYLQSLELKKVVLDGNQQTEFNGYDIGHDCFLVD